MMSAHTANGVCRARADGELTIYSAGADLTCLQECLQHAAELEIDLSAVDEIDSAGVQLLIQAKREGARAGKPVRLVGHSPAVMEIIDLFHLAPLFGDPMVVAPRAPHDAGGAA